MVYRSQSGKGWSLVIFPVEMELPDGKPAEFDCSWVPSSRIDIVVRSSPEKLSSALDKMYARGYYPNWHNLKVPVWPGTSEVGAGIWSSDPSQDFPPYLPHHTYDGPYDFTVPKDYTEHFTEHCLRFNIYKQQRALMCDRQLYVRVVAPTDYTCAASKCVITDHLIEDHIPRTVVVHRHYLLGLPPGTRNPRARAGDIWFNPGHTAPFAHWMNRHKPGSIMFDHNLPTATMDAEIHAMLDSPAWNPRHVPNSLSWLHSESVTLICDLVVSIIMELLEISPQKILAHIRMIYATEM